MNILPPPPRLASAAVVLFGDHGDVARHARHRGVCRQRLYRETDAVLRDLDPQPNRRLLDQLRQRITQLEAQVQQQQAQLDRAVVATAALHAEFAATAQAEGVSLPVARRLLAVLLRQNTPSVATLGRLSQRAARRAGPLLAVLDERARACARQVAADEIFVGRRPVLMVVEPDSHCWLSGRLAPRRDGAAWAQELGQYPALEHLVRDGGSGLAGGLRALNARRRRAGRAEVSGQLDHFHTLREGQRGLSRLQAQARRALGRAEAAQRKADRQQQQGQPRLGTGVQAARSWRRAEAAFDTWQKAERTVEQIRRALQPLDERGEPRPRAAVEAEVRAALEQLPAGPFAKFARLLRRPASYTYLDRLQAAAAALPVSAPVRRAVLGAEGLRRQPARLSAAGAAGALWRALALVWGVLLHAAGEAGAQAVQAWRGALREVGRASSAVEGINSVLRMQQRRHRRLNQELLDLKRLYWNRRAFRTGRRRRTTPYERLGLQLPSDLTWWQILHLEPDELRKILSAPQAPS